MQIRVLVLTLLTVWFLVIQDAQAVAISEGVILDPQGSLAKFVWNCVYEDNMSLIAKSTWIQVGGIKCTFNPTTELTVLIHAWNPENKGEPGEVVFDLSTISQQEGGFEAVFENLIPGQKYEIWKNGKRWKVLRADEHGTLKFADRVGSENRYVIRCAGAPTPTPTTPPPIPPIPTPPTPPIPGFEALLAIAGLAGTAYLLGRK